MRSPDTGTAQGLVAEAAIQLGQGEIAEALTLIDRALPLAPQDPAPAFLGAIAAWRSQDPESAIEILRRLLDSHPRNGTIADTLAVLSAGTGDAVDAAYYGKLATALTRDEALSALLPPDFPEFSDAFLNIAERPLFRRGMFLVRNGAPGEGLGMMQKHARLFPDDEEAAEAIVTILMRQDRAAEAYAYAGALSGSSSAGRLSLAASVASGVGRMIEAGSLHLQALEADSADDPDCLVEGRAACDAWRFGGNDARPRAFVRRYLEQQLPASPARPRRSRRRIGYLVSGLVDPVEARAAIAAVRQHDPGQIELAGFMAGSPDDPCNAPFAGAFEIRHDISQLDPWTLARIFDGEGLELLVDLSGWRCPVSMAALCMTTGLRRIGWLGLHAPADFQPHDRMIGPGAWQETAGRDVIIPCGPAGLTAPEGPLAPPRDRQRREIVLGLDLPLSHIPGTLADSITAAMDHAPDITLLLRSRGAMTSQAGIDRLMDLFGDKAGRVDLMPAATAGEFLGETDILFVPSESPHLASFSAAMKGGRPVLVEADGAYAGAAAQALARTGLGDVVIPDRAVLGRNLAALCNARDRWDILVKAQQERLGCLIPDPAAVARSIEAELP